MVEIKTLNFILMNVLGTVTVKSIQIVGPTALTALFHRLFSMHTEFTCHHHNDQNKGEAQI